MATLMHEKEKELSDSSVEKLSVGDSIEKPIDDVQMVKEVEDLEDRLEHDEATEDEYRVEEAYEVAIKVSIERIVPQR